MPALSYTWVKIDLRWVCGSSTCCSLGSCGGAVTEKVLSFIPIATVVVSVRVGIGVVEGPKDGVILEINRCDVVLVVEVVVELRVCMMIGWQVIRAWLVAASVSVVWSGASIPILRLISHFMMRHHT